MRHTAIYPGTFDPLTLGHLDLIVRASRIFTRVIVAVAIGTRKSTIFPIEERVAMTAQSTRNLPNVEVTSFRGLLVHFAIRRGVHVVVRGLRAFSDFEYEFQMALTNRKLEPRIETLYLMPKEEFSYFSSSTVREVVELGGDYRGFVPKTVQPFIHRRFGGHRAH